jgi:pimeloyl-ACP methyl ester carboxylesterase
MRKLAIILIPILVIGGALEYLLFDSIRKFTKVSKKEEINDPKDLLLSANDINFQTDDGVSLHGWLIQGKSGYPALIIAHPYGANRSTTLIKLEGLISNLNKQGYFVFLFDFRGHGQSSSTSALGFRESADLNAAVKEVLKYKQIARRIGVLGVGMGAIAASQAFQSVDEVKFLILDSIYEDISTRYADAIIVEWPFLAFSKPVLAQGLDLNFRHLFRIPSTDLNLSATMPKLYPKVLLFVDKTPPANNVLALYKSAREPKELLQMQETAAGELIGETRDTYNRQIEEKIKKYLPPVSNEKTLEIGK